MKTRIIIAIGMVALMSSCGTAEETKQSRKDLGAEWILRFAKEEFGSDAFYLSDYTISEASKDSSRLVYIFKNDYTGDNMTPFTVYFDNEGNVIDSLTDPR